jgi:hypothetical protein
VAKPEEGGFTPAEEEQKEEESALTNKDFFWDWEGS